MSPLCQADRAYDRRDSRYSKDWIITSGFFFFFRSFFYLFTWSEGFWGGRRYCHLHDLVPEEKKEEWLHVESWPRNVTVISPLFFFFSLLVIVVGAFIIQGSRLPMAVMRTLGRTETVICNGKAHCLFRGTYDSLAYTFCGRAGDGNKFVKHDDRAGACSNRARTNRAFLRTSSRRIDYGTPLNCSANLRCFSRCNYTALLAPKSSVVKSN